MLPNATTPTSSPPSQTDFFGHGFTRMDADFRYKKIRVNPCQKIPTNPVILKIRVPFLFIFLMPRRIWVACLIVLLAFTVRVAFLERRPLHFDEGNNVYFGLRATHLLQDSIDHAEADPPLHRLALGAWMALAGTTPFAIRFLSAGWGVLAVALPLCLARVLLRDDTQAITVAALMALAVFHIDYSQEAKGYALVSAAALFSTLAWLHIRQSRRAWIAYMVGIGVMLGTHYFAAPLLGMHWLMLAPERRHWRYWPRYLSAQVIACLPIVGWIALAWRGIVAGGMRAASTPFGFHPIELLGRIFGEFAAGRYAEAWVWPLAALLLGVLWLLGLMVLWRRGMRVAFWASASVVLALAFAEVVAPRLSIFYPRFLLWALAFVLIAAVAFFAGRWFAIGVRALALISMVGTLLFYRSPIDPQTDYRPLFAQVWPYVREGDVALGTYIWMDGMAASYAPETKQKLTWVRDFYQNDGSDIEQLMQPLPRQSTRLWQFHFERDPDDPAVLSAVWLRQHGAEVARWQQGTLSALLFDLYPSETQPCCLQAQFGDVVVANWSPLPNQLRAGDVLRVDVQWQALQRETPSLGISLQLLGPDGKLIVQRDADAVNGLSPSFTWKPDQPVLDARALLLPNDLPVGRYRLYLVVYRREDGQRLTIANGADGAEMGVFDVTR